MDVDPTVAPTRQRTPLAPNVRVIETKFERDSLECHTLRRTSPFQRRLNHYIKLTDDHISLLSPLEQHPQRYGTERQICGQGDRAERLWVVRSGWLYGQSSLPDGGRHVFRFYLPGDIVGLSALASTRYPFDVSTITDSVVCPFPKRALSRIFLNTRSLAGLLLAQMSTEEVLWIDRLRAAARMKPTARLAYFFLELLDRLRCVGLAPEGELEVPLTQYLIGDTLGLTNVTVCRALSILEKDSLIHRDRGVIALLDEHRLQQLCDYTNRHRSVDTSWLLGQ